MVGAFGRKREGEILPYWCLALVASRITRRAVLAILNGQDREAALKVCEVLEQSTRDGRGAEALATQQGEVAKMNQLDGRRTAVQALGFALTAAREAEAGREVGLNEAVQSCIRVLSEDPRLSPVQLAILVDSDREQITSACREAGIGLRDGLTKDVLLRLTPCHPLTLSEPRRSAEDECR